MLKMKDIENLSIEELQEKLDKMKKDLMQFRFQAKTAKLERQNLIKENRRDVARILTRMNQIKKSEALS